VFASLTNMLTTYTVKVRAFNVAGFGPFNNATNFTTGFSGHLTLQFPDGNNAVKPNASTKIVLTLSSNLPLVSTPPRVPVQVQLSGPSGCKIGFSNTSCHSSSATMQMHAAQFPITNSSLYVRCLNASALPSSFVVSYSGSNYLITTGLFSFYVGDPSEVPAGLTISTNSTTAIAHWQVSRFGNYNTTKWQVCITQVTTSYSNTTAPHFTFAELHQGTQYTVHVASYLSDNGIGLPAVKTFTTGFVGNFSVSTISGVKRVKRNIVTQLQVVVYSTTKSVHTLPTIFNITVHAS